MLTILLGNISLVKLEGRLEPRLIESLDQMLDAANQTKEITNQLNAFAWRGSAQRKPIALPDLIKKSVTFFVKTAEIECKFDIPDRIWAVFGDVGFNAETGTRFRIVLPAHGKPPAPVTTYSLENIRGGRILVMDDEVLVSRVIKMMLNHLGFEAVLVADGKDAVEAYRKALEEEDPFAVVLLDLLVPGGMGGRETMQELLKIDPDVKAIITSGYYDDPVMMDYQKYGFYGTIRKPYELTQLTKALASIP